MKEPLNWCLVLTQMYSLYTVTRAHFHLFFPTVRWQKYMKYFQKYLHLNTLQFDSYCVREHFREQMLRLEMATSSEDFLLETHIPLLLQPSQPFCFRSNCTVFFTAFAVTVKSSHRGRHTLARGFDWRLQLFTVWADFNSAVCVQEAV